MGPANCDVWLIRHGETEWSLSGAHTGRSDIPLTKNGERQGGLLREFLAGQTFALVLSSPLQRAWETCRLAGFGGKAEKSDDLMEFNYGAYEGHTSKEIQQEVPGWNVWTGELPGGETVDEVGIRADRVIAQARQAGGNVGLFAHGHILRILTARWLGLPAIDGRYFALNTGSVSVLGYEREQAVVQSWNHVPPGK